MNKLIFLLTCLVLAYTGKATGQTTLLTSLEEYYTLDESSGQAIDEVGNNNSSTVSATYSAQGKVNTAFSFNGSTNRITFADHANWTISASGTLSISLWIYMPGNQTQTYVTLWGHQNGPMFYLTKVSDGNYKICWWTGGTEALTGTLAFSMNTWYHIVMVKNGSTITFYRNGTSVTSVTTTDATINPPAVYIGGDTYSTPQSFYGRIDEVGIWKRVLTSTEITTLYNTGSGLGYPFGLGEQPTVSYKYDQSGNRTSKNIISLKSATGSSSPSTDEQPVNVVPEDPFKDNLGGHTILIYPNPVESELTINIDGLEENTTGTIKVFDQTGRLVLVKEQPLESNTLDFKALSPGSYFVNITLDGKITRWKIIKQ